MTHDCKYCENPLVRREREPPSKFRERSYCDKVCRASHALELKRERARDSYHANKHGAFGAWGMERGNLAEREARMTDRMDDRTYG